MIWFDLGDLSEQDGRDRNDLLGCLCMCDSDLRAEPSKELIGYEGGLLREILSVNLANAKLHEKYLSAESKLRTDALTGLGTRRVLEERIRAECVRCDRYGRAFSVVMIDVDHFKAVNDKLGHSVGDKTLVAIASYLISQKRASDVIVRYGGDEFIILMPETSLDEAMGVMERLCYGVKGLVLPKGYPITISCGVVEQDPSVSVSGKTLIRRADLALYKAKDAGGNRVECWEWVTSPR